MVYYEIMKRAAEKEGLTFNENKYNQFMEYKKLLQEWNEKINLTAITEDEQMVKKHFIDSMKAFRCKYLKNARNIIDIGTGAGFPGIPIKIVEENMKIVLLDSLNKRINFLNEVVSKLGLECVETKHGRAEDFAQDKNYREKFDIAISRAVANMAVLVELCLPYVKKGGYFIAMKGPAIEEELQQCKKAVELLGGKVEEVIQVDIEDSDLNHNLVIIKKVKNTPFIYPRKAGIINKKPLK